MRNKKKSIIISFMLSFLLISCSSTNASWNSTPRPLENVEGILFFDYDGNGVNSENEPAIANFGVCLKTQNNCVNTDDNGHFIFEKIATAGTSVLVSFIDPNENDPSHAFKYTNLWKETVTIPTYEINDIQVPEQILNATEITPIDQGLSLHAGENTSIGLLQGRLHIAQDFPLYIQFDIDTREGYARDWQGRDRNPPSPYSDYWFDNHTGIDFYCSEGDFVQAFSPGNVNYVGDNGRGALIVEGTLFDGFTFHYGHLSSILVNDGDVIHRGQILGQCGHSGTDWSHIHFQLGSNGAPLDPFSDLTSPSSSENFWTFFNDPYKK